MYYIFRNFTKKSTFLILLTILLISSGCSSINTSFDYNPTFPFHKIHYYSWFNSNKNKHHNMDSLIDQRVKQALTQQLTQKGLTYTNNNQKADILVQWMILHHHYTQQHILVTNNFLGAPSLGLTSDSIINNYPVTWDTLKINIYKQDSGNLIWQAISSDGMLSTGNPQERTQQINRLVNDMMKHYPPQNNQ